MTLFRNGAGGCDCMCSSDVHYSAQYTYVLLCEFLECACMCTWNTILIVCILLEKEPWKHRECPPFDLQLKDGETWEFDFHRMTCTCLEVGKKTELDFRMVGHIVERRCEWIEFTQDHVKKSLNEMYDENEMEHDPTIENVKLRVWDQTQKIHKDHTFKSLSVKHKQNLMEVPATPWGTHRYYRIRKQETQINCYFQALEVKWKDHVRHMAMLVDLTLDCKLRSHEYADYMEVPTQIELPDYLTRNEALANQRVSKDANHLRYARKNTAQNFEEKDTDREGGQQEGGSRSVPRLTRSYSTSSAKGLGKEPARHQ